MHKSHTKKQIFLCLFLFIFGSSNTFSLGTSYQDLSANAHPQYASAPTQKTGIFSNWFKNAQAKPRSTPIATNTAASNEIWHRVRQRLYLRAPQSAPLYHRHIREYAKSQSYINKILNNASPYLYYVLSEVEKRGMPSEIALLPIIESEFNPQTVSHKGAVGLWQLMPVLGRMHGLKQNAWYDGRKDIYESTKVALDHLEYLHKRFDGNWLLALAAYNSGEYRVLSAMKKNRLAKKPTDFWSLNLPKETTHFVPKLLAIVTIIKSPKEYGVVLPSIMNKPVFERINTGKPIDITHAAKLVNVPETHLRKLNPGLHKRAMHPSGPFNLVVPIHQADGLKNKIGTLGTVVSEPVKQTTAKATAKTTTKTTTKTTKAKAAAIPVQATAKAKTTNSAKTHTVRSGESIPTISKKYNIKINTLLTYNKHLKASTILQPGQKIVIAKG